MNTNSVMLGIFKRVLYEPTSSLREIAVERFCDFRRTELC